MNKIKLPQSGYTLIELILYVSIVTFVLTALMTFALNIITATTKSNTQQELYATSRYLTERINYEIRNASDINSVSATSISLATNTPATNPTVIDLTSGNIRITRGAAAAVNLNGNGTTISSLAFTNFTSADLKTKHIRYILTAVLNTSSARKEYKDTVTLESSAEVRSN